MSKRLLIASALFLLPENSDTASSQRIIGSPIVIRVPSVVYLAAPVFCGVLVANSAPSSFPDM